MNDTPKQPEDSQTPLKGSLPSYWLGLGFLAAAVAAKVIGNAMVGSMADSARGQSFIGANSTLNSAASTQRSFDILMVVLGIIGIILLVRAFLVRSKASRS